MSKSKDFIKRFENELKRVIGGIKKITGKLTPEDDWIEGFKRRLAVLLDPYTRPFGRHLVFHCHDEDYLYRVDVDSDVVERALYPDYKRNFTSTRKYRYIDEHGDPIPKGEEDGQLAEKQWSAGAWVLDPDDTEWQHHVYLFEAGDMGKDKCDIYGHKETSAAKDPYGHVTDPQHHGDPDECVVPRLAGAGIKRVKN